MYIYIYPIYVSTGDLVSGPAGAHVQKAKLDIVTCCWVMGSCSQQFDK